MAMARGKGARYGAKSGEAVEWRAVSGGKPNLDVGNGSVQSVRCDRVNGLHDVVDDVEAVEPRHVYNDFSIT